MRHDRPRRIPPHYHSLGLLVTILVAIASFPIAEGSTSPEISIAYEISGLHLISSTGFIFSTTEPLAGFEGMFVSAPLLTYSNPPEPFFIEPGTYEYLSDSESDVLLEVQPVKLECKLTELSLRKSLSSPNYIGSADWTGETNFSPGIVVVEGCPVPSNLQVQGTWIWGGVLRNDSATFDLGENNSTLSQSGLRSGTQRAIQATSRAELSELRVTDFDSYTSRAKIVVQEPFRLPGPIRIAGNSQILESLQLQGGMAGTLYRDSFGGLVYEQDHGVITSTNPSSNLGWILPLPFAFLFGLTFIAKSPILRKLERTNQKSFRYIFARLMVPLSHQKLEFRTHAAVAAIQLGLLTQAAQILLRHNELKEPSSGICDFLLAEISARKGDPKAANEHLNRAILQEPSIVHSIQKHPLLSPIFVRPINSELL